jgi:hypothetical protein
LLVSIGNRATIVGLDSKPRHKCWSRSGTTPQMLVSTGEPGRSVEVDAAARDERRPRPPLAGSAGRRPHRPATRGRHFGHSPAPPPEHNPGKPPLEIPQRNSLSPAQTRGTTPTHHPEEPAFGGFAGMCGWLRRSGRVDGEVRAAEHDRAMGLSTP